MLGGPIDAWFYKGVLGIYPTKPGYEELAIRPQIGGGLTFAKGYVQTPRGKVGSEWRVNGSAITLNVTIPFNSKAAVSFPKPVVGATAIYEGSTVVWKSGALVAKTEGMYGAHEDGNYIRFVVGSGHYSFQTQ
jgi:alpha-L-rhamnosidase